MRERHSQLRCPLCDGLTDATPISYVDATADADTLDQLVNGEVNRVICSTCGHSGVLPEPIMIETPDAVIAFMPVEVPTNRKANLARRMNDEANVRSAGKKATKSCFGPRQLRSELLVGAWPRNVPSYWRRFDDLGSPHHRKKILERLDKSGEIETPAKVRLGVTYYQLQSYSAARGILNKVLDQDPANVDALQCLASVELDDKRPERALELFDQLVSITHEPLAHFLAGVAAYRAERHKAARERFEAAIAGDKRYVDAYVWLARASIALDSRPQAIQALRKAAECGLKDANVILQYRDLRVLEQDGAFKAIISAIRKQNVRARQKTRGADRPAYDRAKRKPPGRNRRKSR